MTGIKRRLGSLLGPKGSPGPPGEAPDLSAVELILSISVNVKSFGAVGDGATNDTEAFHDAIDALPEAGGIVNIPEGVYVGAIRVKKPNTHLLGQGWSSVIRTQDNSVPFDTDCPIRLLADGCKVTDLMTDGNPEGNTHINTAALANTADGIGIFANNCYVARVKTSGHLGHHLIAWNKAFPLEDIPAGPRNYNVVENCYSVRRGLRNMLDFASTEELGDHDQNINRYNVFRNNIIEGGEIVIHTGWDTVVEGNHIIGGGGITVHTGSRRVYVRNNILDGCSMVLRGGLADAWTAGDRRSKEIEAVGNKLHNPGSSAIYVLATDDFLLENNTIVDALSFGINPESTSHGIIRNNRIRGGIYGIRPGTMTGEYGNPNLTIEGNQIGHTSDRAIFMPHAERCIIQDNQVDGYGNAGIEISATSGESIIRRNTIRGEGIRGIRSNGAADVHIVENIAYNRIEVQGPRTIIKGNTVNAPAYAIITESGSVGSIIIDNIATSETGDAVRDTAEGGNMIKNNVLNGIFTP